MKTATDNQTTKIAKTVKTAPALPVQIYVQLGLSCELYTIFRSFGERERAACQRLSNRFKAEVRAMQGASVLAAYFPHRVECSEGC